MFGMGLPYWLALFVGAIVIILLYDKSPAFRYKFKFAFYIVQMQICGLYIIPLALFRPKDVRNIHFGVPYMRLIGKFLGIKWEISGGEILEKDFPCVVICNHQSMLDVLGMVELWPLMKKCAAVAKQEVFYVLPFGPMAWLCGTVFINRGNRGQSQVKISTTAEKIRENKTKLWIFPEGTRSKKESLLPFKKGAFHIAIQNKLPVVPVVISPYTFIDDDKKIFNSGTMKLKVLNPVDTSDLERPEDASKLAEKCYELMNLEFQKMQEEMNVAGTRRERNNQSLTNGIKSSNGHAHSEAKPSAVGFDEDRRTS